MSDLRRAARILHLLSSLKIGGAERMTVDLAAYQKRQGLNVSILSFGTGEDVLFSVCINKNVPVKLLSSNRWLRQIQLIQLIAAYDILHIHSPSVMRSISLVLPLLDSKRVIYTRHGEITIDRPKWRSLHLKISPYVDGLTFVSEPAKNNFGSLPGWHSIPKTVIENGIDFEALAHSQRLIKKHPDKIHLGLVGRMVKLKNHIALFKALALLAKPQRQSYELHCFGDGPCLQALKNFHTAHLIDITVRYYGLTPEREKIYPSFDILVVTSLTEGLSMAILEAMATGHPVVASRVGGNPLLVKPNATGWLFNVEDIPSLAQILINLAHNPSIIKTLGEQARHFVSQHFDLAKTAEQYNALYMKQTKNQDKLS